MLNKYEKENTNVKQNIMDYFLKIQPSLRKKYKQEKQSYCIICGEPSQGKECRACQILKQIKPKRFK